MSEPRGYGEVRQALQERGYLETPLERLFLGGIGDPLGGSRRGRLISSALAGLLAGPLLGVLLAVVVVVEGRGTVPAWPDGVLYALLFAAVVGVLVAVVEAVTVTAIRAVGRARPGLSARRAALAAGLVVAVAFAAYFGIWWVRSGGRPTFADLAALVVLALGAGFAGRVVSAAALVHAALATGRAPLRRRPRFLAILAALALVAAGLAALVPRLSAAGGRAAEALDADAPPSRALIVAWDGLGAPLARGLVRQDASGNLYPFLRAQLATGARVEVGPAWDPVVGWTTVATGSPPAAHGIAGVEMTGLRGAASPVPRAGLAAGPMQLLTRLWPTERRIVRAGVRQVPAFWEVTATRAKTAVVGWWGTWPAAAPGPKGGYVVSDGAIVALRSGNGIGVAVHPPAWGTGRGAEWLARAGSGAGATGNDRQTAELVREARVIDLFAVAALDDALADPDVAAAAIYLPGLDILRERFRRMGRDPFETLDAAAAHVAVVDRALAAVVERRWSAGPGQVWLVGLPGRTGEGEDGFVAAAAGRGALDADLAAGPACVPLVGIAPSWLAASGYPIDDRMTGPALAGACLPRSDARRVRTAAVAAAPPPASEALEGDVLERLRSLGYVR